MTYRLIADFVLVVHALFVAFVIFGGLIALWRNWVAWLHLPALVWGATIIALGWICPLTPLENSLRQMAGLEGYGTGFIEHYLLQFIYPQGLTREIQIALAILLVLGNLAIYLVLYRRCRKRRIYP